MTELVLPEGRDLTCGLLSLVTLASVSMTILEARGCSLFPTKELWLESARNFSRYASQGSLPFVTYLVIQGVRIPREELATAFM